jgi:hypothetical protein
MRKKLFDGKCFEYLIVLENDDGLTQLGLEHLFLKPRYQIDFKNSTHSHI